MDDNETAGLPLPPPLIFAGTLALGLLVGRVTAGERGAALARGTGTAAIAAGIGLGAAAAAAMRRAGTKANPFVPSTALVRRGVFARTRNPIYVGMTSVYIGVALRARSVFALTFLPVALALVDRLIVAREERYLERRFGESYRAYRDAVPRWF